MALAPREGRGTHSLVEELDRRESGEGKWAWIWRWRKDRGARSTKGNLMKGKKLICGATGHWESA